MYISNLSLSISAEQWLSCADWQPNPLRVRPLRRNEGEHDTIDNEKIFVGDLELNESQRVRSICK